MNAYSKKVMIYSPINNQKENIERFLISKDHCYANKKVLRSTA